MNKTTSPARLIALTGATGFVGSHILNEALKSGYQVKALTRRPQEDRKNVTWVPGDIENEKALRDLVDQADFVIHGAGVVKALKADDFHNINEAGVKRTLDAVLDTKAANKDPHFLLVSSLAAREPHLSHYADSKHRGERVLHKNREEIPWTILRPPAVYGPGDREILKLFRTMKRGLAPVAGNLKNRFSLIHAEDFSRCTMETLGNEKAFQCILEPDDGKERGYTIEELAEIASRIMGRPVKPVEVPPALLKGFAFFNEMASTVTRRAPMLSRHKVNELSHPNWVTAPETREILPHWKPEKKLEEGLRETFDWYVKAGLL